MTCGRQWLKSSAWQVGNSCQWSLALVRGTHSLAQSSHSPLTLASRTLKGADATRDTAGPVILSSVTQLALAGSSPTKGSNHAGVTVVAAPSGTVHAGVTAQPCQICSPRWGNGRNRAQRFSPRWGDGRSRAQRFSPHWGDGRSRAQRFSPRWGDGRSRAQWEKKVYGVTLDDSSLDVDTL